ncbi:monocarboxylate transporter 12 [Galendromus occidentalis]|uniref:Monocarboxylate transporter 12 n=1 Tax=Galendromus occidentalis TaxID=34638 RepID=A0AAJ6QN34_9ACAR|nr:monocarboxylate transporter 12 [Galendromus occidentalis]
MIFSSIPATGPDSRRSFMTAALLTLVLCMSSSGFRSAGFLYIGIMDTMKVSRGEASWPLSLIGAVTHLSGVISGPLCQMYSPRPLLLIGTLIASSGMMLSSIAQNVFQLTVTMGLVYGLGNGLVLTTTNIFITQHFVEYRAIAFGIVYGGSTLASVIFPTLLLWLSGFFAFNYVLLTLGGILLNMFVLSLLVYEPEYIVQMKKEVAADSTQKRGVSLDMIKSLMTTVPFYVLLISNIALQWAFDAFMTTLVDFAMDKGCTLTQAVDLLPWFSVADFIGRVIMPIACDRGLIKRQNLITISYTMCGVGLSTLPLSYDYPSLVCAILFMGLFMGTSLVLFACMVGDFVGLERLPIAFAILGVSNGMFFFLKPTFFGFFRDNIKSYDGMFWFCSSLGLFTGFMWIGLLIYLRRQGAEEEKSDVELSTREAAAYSAAAAVAPSTALEAVRRGSMLSACSNISSPEGLYVKTRMSVAVDNLAYVAEETFEQRL